MILQDEQLLFDTVTLRAVSQSHTYLVTLVRLAPAPISTTVRQMQV